MRFCNLKTYRSAFRQLIVFHPSVFEIESDLGLFIAICTSSFWHIAVHVSVSRTLLHPFSGVDRCFGLGVSFLNHPFHPVAYYLTVYLLIDHNRSHREGYFVPDIHWFESLGYVFPPGF